jgi:NAD-dependent SIR2 family protein deacetylase
MHALPDLVAFVRAHPRLFVLTGAGVSTASGIPGYRDAHGQWQRKAPVTHQQFTGSDAVRKRYWARSMLGWPVIARAQPNAAHRALAQLESAGHVHHLVTQNVDGLHQRAGSQRVIDLACGMASSRAALQSVLLAANAQFAERTAATAPDGDAELETDFDTFVVPACTACGGMLKPDVVFYGANVPRQRVDAALAALDGADALLVVGSSLMVYSGYRFCEHAHARRIPIAALNRGHTRADKLLALKVEADCGMALSPLAAQLAGHAGSAATPA